MQETTIGDASNGDANEGSGDKTYEAVAMTSVSLDAEAMRSRMKMKVEGLRICGGGVEGEKASPHSRKFLSTVCPTPNCCSFFCCACWMRLCCCPPSVGAGPSCWLSFPCTPFQPHVKSALDGMNEESNPRTLLDREGLLQSAALLFACSRL
ncbi:hypothetical protein VIGAN_09061200 [Vigna angularis var. angularis]|uniref:Uncharacterized protein n=1 Tax=Vigna angularis var. angularis TaxID=157739 RepID=A0A0S3SX69_PHAAN|nr:hypothetical protein VIGAN_09061200 [Vigna angularis var. angularis]